MFRHYSYVHIENNLKKHLFENARCSLYVWTTLAGMVEKIQFEINDHSAIELSFLGCDFKFLSDGDFKHKNCVQNIFNRTFAKPMKGCEKMNEAIELIESNYASETINEIKKMLLKRHFEVVEFKP